MSIMWWQYHSDLKAHFILFNIHVEGDLTVLFGSVVAHVYVSPSRFIDTRLHKLVGRCEKQYLRLKSSIEWCALSRHCMSRQLILNFGWWWLSKIFRVASQNKLTPTAELMPFLYQEYDRPEMVIINWFDETRHETLPNLHWRILFMFKHKLIIKFNAILVLALIAK